MNEVDPFIHSASDAGEHSSAIIEPQHGFADPLTCLSKFVQGCQFSPEHGGFCSTKISEALLKSHQAILMGKNEVSEISTDTKLAG